MRFTIEQYNKAIAALTDAKKQLEPDGYPCAICSDSGHMAWECGFNPLLAVFMCNEIAQHSEQLHMTLHSLAGHIHAFGERLGPSKIVGLQVTCPICGLNTSIKDGKIEPHSPSPPQDLLCSGSGSDAYIEPWTE